MSRRIATDAGVADVSGYTDYGRVWVEFLDKVVDDLDPRSTVIVLGDARTNGREPHAQVFGHVAERAGRTFWINPEPRLYWNYGDSVMSAYEPFCDGVFECWTTKQLEAFVNAVRARAPRGLTVSTVERGPAIRARAEIALRPGADPSNLWGNAREGVDSSIARLHCGASFAPAASVRTSTAASSLRARRHDLA